MVNLWGLIGRKGGRGRGIDWWSSPPAKGFILKGEASRIQNEWELKREERRFT
jgi:hypothetical protein